MVTVLPDYRLYPQVKFPQFLDDGALAVAWVQKHAQEFGGDPHRIVLMGHSAGGHEAAFLAYDGRLPQSPPTLLVHGTADDVVSIKHTEELRDVLQANQVRVETQFYPGKRHADTIAGFSIPARGRTPVLDQSVAFIESVTSAVRIER